MSHDDAKQFEHVVDTSGARLSLRVILGLLDLTADDLREIGIPIAAVAKLGRLRERLRGAMVAEAVKVSPRGEEDLAWSLFNGPRLDEALRLGGEPRLLKTLLAQVDQQAS